MDEAPVKRVYVPSVIEEEQGPIGLGCFSEEATAWRVLRAFLRKTERMRLERASVVAWDVDVIGEDGMTELAHLQVRDCPVCRRRTMWVDLRQFSALCYGSACEAWVEEHPTEKDTVDCGWPQTRFFQRCETAEEAFEVLAGLGRRTSTRTTRSVRAKPKKAEKLTTKTRPSDEAGIGRAAQPHCFMRGAGRRAFLVRP